MSYLETAFSVNSSFDLHKQLSTTQFSFTQDKKTWSEICQRMEYVSEWHKSRHLALLILLAWFRLPFVWFRRSPQENPTKHSLANQWELWKHQHICIKIGEIGANPHLMLMLFSPVPVGPREWHPSTQNPFYSHLQRASFLSKLSVNHVSETLTWFEWTSDTTEP